MASFKIPELYNRDIVVSAFLIPIIFIHLVGIDLDFSDTPIGDSRKRGDEGVTYIRPSSCFN